MLNFLKNLFSTKNILTEKDKIYDWLASSSSLEEIERRQRMLDRGEAPWQVRANQNLKGWI